MIPSSFEDELHREFGGRFRIRWSNRREEYHIEYKVLPGQVLEPPKGKDGRYDTEDDDYIRARDGYDFIVAIRRGDRMPCPACGATMAVSKLEMKESVCQSCMRLGGQRDGRFAVVYYPLNHILIEHLRFIDPLNGGGDRVKKHLHRVARQQQLARERALGNDVEAATADNFTRLFDIQSVGYTGKEHAWEHR